MVTSKYGLQNYKYYNKKKKLKLKLEIVCIYNLTKSGCDLIDNTCAIYHSQRKSKKWWKEIFFYLIDACLKNIIIIYYSSDKYHDINKRNRQRDYPRTRFKCNNCNKYLCKHCYDELHK